MTLKTFIPKLSAPVTIPFWLWLLLCVNLGYTGSSLLPNPFSRLSSPLERQVRQWAKEYPSDLRDRWAWCYLDSAENWSTDQKLREDVRLKSTQVLTADERETLSPLDQKISTEVPKQKTPLKDTYTAVGNGLKVTQWSPPPEPPPKKEEPTVPNRRRLIRRQ
jgi:hypothetical protein